MAAMATKQKRRRRKRKTRKRKRGGNGDENKNPNWKKLRKRTHEKIIKERGEKLHEQAEKRRIHYNVALPEMVQKTEAATADREAKKKEFSKFVMTRPEKAVVKPREIIFMNRIIRPERSFEEEKKLLAEKQKKINKSFGKNYGKKLNDVITDETHPDYFQQRKARILTLIKKKDDETYSRLCGNDNPAQENTGCSRKIGNDVGANNLTGKQLLDAIAKHFNITPEDEKFKQKKGGKRTRKRKRRKRKRRKRRKSRRKR